MSWDEGIDRGRIGNSGRRGQASVLDAGIIVAAQKVEHYEIAPATGASARYRATGPKENSRAASETTLDEESEANELLNGLAGAL